MVFSIFQANKKAKSAEVNANFAFVAGNRLIAFNASTGAAIGTFQIGDLTAITNGSLAGDLLARSGEEIKVYNSSGALIGSISYDNLLNLRTATTTEEGVGEIATNAETLAGTQAGAKFLNPANLASIYNSSARASNYIRIPVLESGFKEIIIQTGSGTTNGTVTFPLAFPNALLSLTFGSNGNENGVPRATSQTLSSFVYQSANITNTDFNYIAIGY